MLLLPPTRALILRVVGRRLGRRVSGRESTARRCAAADRRGDYDVEGTATRARRRAAAAARAVSEPALSLAFFDPEHEVARDGAGGGDAAVRGRGSRALPEGPRIEADGDGWRAELEGGFSLEFEPVAEGAPTWAA